VRLDGVAEFPCGGVSDVPPPRQLRTFDDAQVDLEVLNVDHPEHSHTVAVFRAKQSSESRSSWTTGAGFLPIVEVDRTIYLICRLPDGGSIRATEDGRLRWEQYSENGVAIASISRTSNEVVVEAVTTTGIVVGRAVITPSGSYRSSTTGMISNCD